MLLGGAFLANVLLSDSRRFWWHLPLLVLAAWLANTFRILLTAGVAAWWDPDLAQGVLHEGEGWLVLTLAFVLCGGMFLLLRERRSSPQAPAPTGA